MGMRKSGPSADWSTDAGRSLEPVPPQPASPKTYRVTDATERPAHTRVTASETGKPRKFTALVDADTDARFGRLLDQLRASAGPVATRPDGNGRTRGGYDLSRADLLRSLLAVAEDDPQVMRAVEAAARAHYGTP